MTIYIDSAILDEAKIAKSCGWVRGLTTNPILLAKAGGKPREVLEALAKLEFEQLFYQLISQTLDDMRLELQLASKIIGRALVVKIPPTETGFQFVSQNSDKLPFCVTAVYHPAQAIVAREAGARYVAVYVNRATRLLGDGFTLVRDVGSVLTGSPTEIIAASVKSSNEAFQSVQAGAHHLTLPFNVLVGMTSHSLSVDTLAEFQKLGTGIQ